ncbi:hypothetical protein L0V05_12690 [Tabrizicola sp. J26]|nr:hypothetical protein [Tabrizicola rongguiensis]MCF1709670.1 hypothetical protein [Tabrizicola rongguiensis]
MAVEEEMQVGHLGRMFVDADAGAADQMARGHQHFGATRHQLGLPAGDKHPVLLRHDQIARWHTRPERACRDPHRTKLRLHPQAAARNGERANPDQRLRACVAGQDQIARLERFNAAVTVRRRDHRARGQAGREGKLVIADSRLSRRARSLAGGNDLQRHPDRREAALAAEERQPFDRREAGAGVVDVVAVDRPGLARRILQDELVLRLDRCPRAIGDLVDRLRARQLLGRIVVVEGRVVVVDLGAGPAV